MRQEMADLATVTNRHKVLLTHLLLIVTGSLVVDAIGTMFMYFLDRHAAGTEIHSVFDAFFFTTVQLLTVSSQLKNPVTTGGRVVDVFLEIWAVLVVAGSAGAFANFVQSDS